mgnify:CR=1 FL=1
MIKEALRKVLEKQQEVENRAWEVMEEADEQLSESKGAKVY